jgi:hypothetical protein
MAAKKGNAYHKLASAEDLGRPVVFGSAQEILDKAQLYIKWTIKNPLKEQKVFAPSAYSEMNEPTVASFDKMRALTIEGFASHGHFGVRTFHDYGEKEDFSHIVEYIKNYFHAYNVEGAAADLLNANIIARKEGLKDAKELSTSPENPLTLMLGEIAGVTIRPKD